MCLKACHWARQGVEDVLQGRGRGVPKHWKMCSKMFYKAVEVVFHASDSCTHIRAARAGGGAAAAAARRRRRRGGSNSSSAISSNRCNFNNSYYWSSSVIMLM